MFKTINAIRKIVKNRFTVLFVRNKVTKIRSAKTDKKLINPKNRNSYASRVIATMKTRPAIQTILSFLVNISIY